MRRRTFLAACVALPLEPEAQRRFGRETLEPEDRRAVAISKIDDLDAPAISIEGLGVACLAYRDPARLYLELEVRNGTGKELPVARDFIAAEQGGRKLARTRAVAVARDLETESLRPEVPEEVRESALALAAFLGVFAQEAGPAAVPAGDDMAIACTFEPPANERDAVAVTIRLGGQAFRFRFRPGRLKTHT